MLPSDWNEYTVDQKNQWLRSALAQDLNITFTKVDGTLRTMPCTLRSDALPTVAISEQKKSKVYKSDTLSVWCLDKQEWRSFRVMNVQKVEVLSTKS
jgi:hypothetical protein